MTVLSLLQRCIFNKITTEPDILRRGATTTTTTTCVWMVHRKSVYVYVCAWVRVCSSNYILLLITMRRAYSTYMCSTIRLIFFFYILYGRSSIFALRNNKSFRRTRAGFFPKCGRKESTPTLSLRVEKEQGL